MPGSQDFWRVFYVRIASITLVEGNACITAPDRVAEVEFFLT